MIRSYQELCSIRSLEDRYQYLRIGGTIGLETFGADRYLNQILYTSDEWRAFRRSIIIRDECCDLAVYGYDILSRPTVHHLNPITIEDVIQRRDCLFDPENAVCASHNTHMAIHYGDKSMLLKLPEERRRGDTCPWRKTF